MARPFIPTAERYGGDLPSILRLLGCFRREPGSAEFRWGQITWKTFGVGLTYSIYHDRANVNIHFLWLSAYLRAPVLIEFRPGTEDWNACYGLRTFGDAIHCTWRTRCKLIHFPWAWSHLRTSVFDAAGNKRPEIPQYDGGPYQDSRHIETHPFVYVRRSGEIQNRIATIHGCEMEWRWRWFRWLPWPRMIKRSIKIDFDDEVGERSGSWKGGCTGCSFEWRNGESMKSCLQRMQHEREFQ